MENFPKEKETHLPRPFTKKKKKNNAVALQARKKFPINKKEKKKTSESI